MKLRQALKIMKASMTEDGPVGTIRGKLIRGDTFDRVINRVTWQLITLMMYGCLSSTTLRKNPDLALASIIQRIVIIDSFSGGEQNEDSTSV